MTRSKIVLITGVSTGIGKSFIQLADSKLPGYKIIALTLHKVKYSVPKNTEVFYVDITNHEATNKIVQKIINRYGRIDVLINNAGNGWRGMVEDTTIKEAKTQMELNVWSVVNLIQSVLPIMRSRKHGHIINISSVAATIDYGTIGYYSATKAFIEKLSSVLAREVMPWNIKVSLVVPGAIKTKFGHNMINIKRYTDMSSPYAAHYKDWANKFELMFQKPIASEVVANRIIGCIHKPFEISFISVRDTFYCYLKRIMPRGWFNALLLKRYMRI